ncbi:MAG: hypothetical protein CBC42_07440 [Betaproteobacteria bacterium TMED82]|nr:MAG: hypothetical protein CBC42_07440 [Betaproteobacteria bacterium TMED82]|tara:strand:+ start:4777 stop:5325 length:549 start_codon:yes stop_codon:yes gene_type:complete
MKFCSECGSTSSLKIPLEDNRERVICDECGYIQYENPKIVVGTLCTYENKILLCKRAIEPRYGFWTLPAGFLELNESTREGATRETIEESGAEIIISKLYAIFDLPFCNQVHMFYLAHLQKPSLCPGHESLEARLFEINQIPWSELSFASVKKTLDIFVGCGKETSTAVYNEVLEKKNIASN